MVPLVEITGSISVIGSFLAGVHQFYLGYIYEGADGFSPALLAGWLIGDLCNLVGTFWTHQLVFQRIIALASTLNDLALAGQHFYYKRKHALKPVHALQTSQTNNGRFLATQWNALLRPYILFTLVSAARAHSAIFDDIDDDEIDFEFLIGQCMAWVAEISYALALVPQVMDNFSRKSTGSVSVVVFLADCVSSTNYLATILLTMMAKTSHRKRVAFVLEELPYIFGTAMCALLDLVLLVQYYAYPNFVIEVVREENVEHPDEQTVLLMPTASTSSYNYMIPS